MDLKESSTEIKKARRDHSLEWEARSGDPRNVDETRWRVEINLAGDRVVSARGFWKLPEAWQRGRERENALAIALAVLKIATLAGLIVFGMWLLIQGTRHGIVRWRAAIRLALPATLLFPLAPLLSVGLMLKNYRTDVPLETFQALAYVSIVMGAIFGFLLMGASAAIIVTYFPDALPALRRTNRAAMAFRCHRRPSPPPALVLLRQFGSPGGCLIPRPCSPSRARHHRQRHPRSAALSRRPRPAHRRRLLCCSHSRPAADQPWMLPASRPPRPSRQVRTPGEFS
jgi:hypothetical protein